MFDNFILEMWGENCEWNIPFWFVKWCILIFVFFFSEAVHCIDLVLIISTNAQITQ